MEIWGFLLGFLCVSNMIFWSLILQLWLILVLSQHYLVPPIIEQCFISKWSSIRSTNGWNWLPKLYYVKVSRCIWAVFSQILCAESSINIAISSLLFEFWSTWSQEGWRDLNISYVEILSWTKNKLVKHKWYYGGYGMIMFLDVISWLYVKTDGWL